jgi:hypothetical protein
MNIKNRIRKIKTNPPVKQAAESEPEVCQHPPSMFKLYRDYPATGYSDSRLVVKGHCDSCGFDDYLWFGYSLTKEQGARRQKLIYASDYWAQCAYDLKLINAGLISYVLYPPSPEVQIKFTGEVKI